MQYTIILHLAYQHMWIISGSNPSYLFILNSKF